MSNGIRRGFVSLSIAALCASFLVIGGDRASANADCDPAAPVADVVLSQTVSPVGGSTDLLKTITLVNLGPCNVPNVSLADTLPAGSTVVPPITTIPGDWSCDASVPGTVSCTRSSAMGVPGTTTIRIRITAPTASEWTDVATANVAPPTVDPVPTNNTSWGAYVTPGVTKGNKTSGGGSLSACTNPNQGEGSGCDQSTAVAATGASGSAEVQLFTGVTGPDDHATTCEDLIASRQAPNCFGQLITVNSPITNALKTLTVNASGAHGDFSGVNVIRTTDGTTWSVVPSCDRTITTTDCVQAKTKFKVNGVTYYQFVVRTLIDDGWGFDG